MTIPDSKNGKETPKVSVRPRGVLRPSYTVNCGDCGMVRQHMPDESITNWKELRATLTSGSSGWKFTKDRGWVCGCVAMQQKHLAPQQPKKLWSEDTFPF